MSAVECPVLVITGDVEPFNRERRMPRTPHLLRRAATRILRMAGYTLARTPRSRELTPEEARDRFDFEAAFSRVRQYSMVGSLGMRSLYDQAVFCERNGIEGAFVECGVWKGGAVGLMALVNFRHSVVRRPLHLFDAFDDICEPDADIDGSRAMREVADWTRGRRPAGRLIPLAGIYANRGGPGHSGEVRRFLEEEIGYDREAMHLHVGWFQDTLPDAVSVIDKIAILRLDADWYYSTKVCLDALFSKVVPGGFVVVDDYGAYEGCRRAVDEFIARLDKPRFLHNVNGEIHFCIK